MTRWNCSLIFSNRIGNRQPEEARKREKVGPSGRE
jgi:hypothetical protein